MVSSYRAARRDKPITPTDAITHNLGDAYAVDILPRLRRFLLIGSAVGTYYVASKESIKEQTWVIEQALTESPDLAIGMMLGVGSSNIAPKHDPVLFALAVAAGFDYGTMELNKKYRNLAYESALEVCRIWTHVSHFLTYRSEAGVAGRGQRRFIREWFNRQRPPDLAYGAIKYPDRDGWSQRDAIILARPRPATAEHEAIFKYILDGTPPDAALGDGSKLIFAREFVQFSANSDEPPMEGILNAIQQYRLPREALPTNLLNDRHVWDAMLNTMPYTALIRNLNKMTMIELLTENSQATKNAIATLTDEAKIKGSRVHPFTILTALKQYELGRGERGKMRWQAVKRIVNALDTAFYLAFGNVPSTGKRIQLGLDVSASMAYESGVSGLSCREVEAAMALVTLATEPNAVIVGYTDRFYDLSKKIRPSMRLDDVLRVIANHPANETFCSLPIKHALKHGDSFDAFVNYTDGETSDRANAVSVALKEYRAKVVEKARHVVVAAAANQFSLADPNDQLSLDIAGFSTGVPTLIGEFVSGNI